MSIKPSRVSTRVYAGKSEKYKHVYRVLIRMDGRPEVLKFHARVGTKNKYHDSEYAAARWVDMTLIKSGQEPVNVLKRLT